MNQPAATAADLAGMDRALALAARAWGDTHPNPMVGAVLMAGGTVLGEGWHARAGAPHAEVMALAAVPDPLPAEATLYVTLEPCSTHGRTPPCTELIRRRGVLRVVVGATDPNPRHAGRGLELLRAAGVEVIAGVRAAEAEDLNLIFNHTIVRQEPLFAVKVATTLDGRTATRSGQSQWITGAAARADVARWRRLFPAIATGVGTLLADDPRLTARLADLPEWCGRRLILDPRGASAERLQARVFSDAFREQTVVVTGPGCPAAARARLEAAGVAVWHLPAGSAAGHRADLAVLRQRCAEAGLAGVLWEAGPGLLGGLLEQGQVDYAFHYQAPQWWGDAQAKPLADGPAVTDPAGGWRLERVIRTQLGDDQLTRGWLRQGGEGRR